MAGIVGGRTMPAQPVAGVIGIAQGPNEGGSILLEGPVVPVAVKNKILQSSREKMFCHQPRASRMIHKDTRKLQLRPAEAEIHRRLSGMQHKFRQIVARAQPCEYAVALPA